MKLTNSTKSKSMYDRLEKERKKLGKNPKCPDCKSILGDSMIVPYFMVCAKCDCYWNPSLTEKKLLKEAFTK